jgi:hypothetical protein
MLMYSTAAAGPSPIRMLAGSPRFPRVGIAR